MLDSVVSETQAEVDLDVVVSDNFKLDTQGIAAKRKAQKILGYMKRDETQHNRRSTMKIYKNLARLF